MAVHQFSDAQVDKARHALGLTRSKTAYRNYYVSADDPDWNDLVERGFASKRQSPVSPEFIYHLSKQAALFFFNEGDRLDGETKFPIIGEYPGCEIKGYES